MLIQPANFDMGGPRNVEFRKALYFEGINFNSVSMKMQIRTELQSAATEIGSPLVTITNETDPDAEKGIYLSEDLSGIQPVSRVEIKMSRGILSGFPQAGRRGDSVTLYYDLVTTGTGFNQLMLLHGKFIIDPWVTAI